MATADDRSPRWPDQPTRRRLPRWLLPVAFVTTLSIALVIGLLVARDEAIAPGSATTPEPVAVDADSIYEFTTLREMARASDLIVVGTVTATEPGRLVGDPADGGVISRLVTIEIEEAIGGSTDGADPLGTVVIEEEGTLPDGTPVIVNGVRGSQVGDHGIWYLDRLDDPEMPVILVINSQGRFLTPAGDPTGDLIGGDQSDPLVQQLQQMPLAALVDATRAAKGGG